MVLQIHQTTKDFQLFSFLNVYEIVMRPQEGRYTHCPETLAAGHTAAKKRG